MNFGTDFFLKSVMLGTGLTMDAFSVSLANGLNEPCMKKRKIFAIAGVFALFQAIMPLTGWLCVHTIVQHFRVFEGFIPWIALILLGFIGGKMLIEGINNKDEDACSGARLGLGTLIIQGIATSIDALSVGFAIAEYDFIRALAAALIIALVTFIICTAGVIAGKTAGTRLSGKAGILGGVVLIVIGLEIFITGVL